MAITDYDLITPTGRTIRFRVRSLREKLLGIIGLTIGLIFSLIIWACVGIQAWLIGTAMLDFILWTIR